ncbi:hypothetical protein N7474_002009 [Penicillium riverlandense]|uniref:uncharacterized protein n=1 Tax=Penicillium riverlandense TaxID=1903569 RepID=UPI0025473843|nr:uncharacterized protein N7474_002009 [Penicillium riverlandense]KAJ5833698.1 hypothetical protein N7474_002009 [Penicillium riverlandense]
MPPFNWDKTKGYSKRGFDKAWKTVDKLGGPVNRLSNRLGAEAFWPMSLDKESDKAARILRSFCKDGFYAPESEVTTDDQGKINRPKGKQRVIKKIPSNVLKQAKGIAVFTTMRTGLWMSGSGGSGVLLARIPETGEWSPPSGIMLHTAGIGFLAGVDIYDCVVIINTIEALEAFKKVRCTLGGEVSAAAGPVGMGGVLDSEVHKRQSPIWTYMKSKGLYAGVAVDGTIIIERTDENERFYGERISVTDILAGKVRFPPDSINTLLQTIKAAQGDSDVDVSLVAPAGETPGDIELPEDDSQPFGVPAEDDPDPYGVKALEAEGLFIREAGTKVRPSLDVFEFRPHHNSPVFTTLSRRSADSSPRNSWRTSSWRASVQSYTSADRGTQTDDAPLTAPTSVSRTSSRSAKEESTDLAAQQSPWDEEPVRWDAEEEKEQDDEQVDYMHEIDSEDDLEVHEVSNATVTQHEAVMTTPTLVEEESSDSKSKSPTFTRARLVTIAKAKRPTPPALPPRHPQHHPQHIWGSESSQDSTSPTALSHSSHSTEPTESNERSESAEPIKSVEPINDLPSNVKTLQVSAVVPAVTDEDFDEDDVESIPETPLDTEEFHSIDGDYESDGGHESDVEDATIVKEDLPAERKESVETVSLDQPEATAEQEQEQEEAQEQEKAQDQEEAQEREQEQEEEEAQEQDQAQEHRPETPTEPLDHKLGEIHIDESRPNTEADTEADKAVTSSVSAETA